MRNDTPSQMGHRNAPERRFEATRASHACIFDALFLEITCVDMITFFRGPLFLRAVLFSRFLGDSYFFLEANAFFGSILSSVLLIFMYGLKFE